MLCGGGVERNLPELEETSQVVGIQVAALINLGHPGAVPGGVSGWGWVFTVVRVSGDVLSDLAAHKAGCFRRLGEDRVVGTGSTESVAATGGLGWRETGFDQPRGSLVAHEFGHRAGLVHVLVH